MLPALEYEVEIKAALRNQEVMASIIRRMNEDRSNQIRREMSILEENQRFCNGCKEDIDRAVYITHRMYRPLLDERICHFKAMLGPSMVFHDEVVSASTVQYEFPDIDLDSVAYAIGRDILRRVKKELDFRGVSGDRYIFAPYVPIILPPITMFSDAIRCNVYTRYGSAIMPTGIPIL